MRANYAVRGDEENLMEFLAITVKPSRTGVHALHMTVRYRRGETSPFAWSNLRPALLFHQSWTAGKLPSTTVWPEHTVFAEPSVQFELSPDAMRDAEAKAGEVQGLLPGDDVKLADVLLWWANRDFPPSYPLPDDLEMSVATQIASCVPSRVAEVILRNFKDAQSLHDFRGWLWQSYWAVMNRPGAQKTS
jgi:hypothetical protein